MNTRVLHFHQMCRWQCIIWGGPIFLHGMQQPQSTKFRLSSRSKAAGWIFLQTKQQAAQHLETTNGGKSQRIGCDRVFYALISWINKHFVIRDVYLMWKRDCKLCLDMENIRHTELWMLKLRLNEKCVKWWGL